MSRVVLSPFGPLWVSSWWLKEDERVSEYLQLTSPCIANRFTRGTWKSNDLHRSSWLPPEPSPAKGDNGVANDGTPDVQPGPFLCTPSCLLAQRSTPDVTTLQPPTAKFSWSKESGNSIKKDTERVRTRVFLWFTWPLIPCQCRRLFSAGVLGSELDAEKMRVNVLN